MTSTLNPQAEALLAQLEGGGSQSLEAAGLFAARETVNAMPALQAPAIRLADVEEILIDGAAGKIPLRKYTPHGLGSAAPVCVFFHGGGWSLGNNSVYDRTCHDIAYATSSIVVYVEYRLAPENKFPAGFDDCFRATEWVYENAASLSGDARRVWVMGDSAGGNLAATVSLKARDSGKLPLAFQLLVYPGIDPRAMGRTRSSIENGEGYSLSRLDVEWVWRLYGRSQADWDNPYFAPASAHSLSNLPPAMIVTAGFDPLRDEAHEYADRLQADGVPTIVNEFPDMIHGFMSMSAAFDRYGDLMKSIETGARSILET